MSAQTTTVQAASGTNPRRWIWWVAAAVLVAAGLALGWEWLRAAGVASLLVSLLPCAIMCALGMCMNRASGSNSCHSDAERPVRGRDH